GSARELDPPWVDLLVRENRGRAVFGGIAGIIDIAEADISGSHVEIARQGMAVDRTGIGNRRKPERRLLAIEGRLEIGLARKGAGDTAPGDGGGANIGRTGDDITTGVKAELLVGGLGATDRSKFGGGPRAGA